MYLFNEPTNLFPIPDFLKTFSVSPSLQNQGLLRHALLPTTKSITLFEICGSPHYYLFRKKL